MREKLFEYLQSYGYARNSIVKVDFFDDNHFFVSLTSGTTMSDETEEEIEKGFEAKYGVKLDIIGNPSWLK